MLAGPGSLELGHPEQAYTQFTTYQNPWSEGGPLATLSLLCFFKPSMCASCPSRQDSTSLAQASECSAQPI